MTASRARGRKGGQRNRLTMSAVNAIKKLLEDPDVTVLDVAKKFGVARSTVYKYLASSTKEAHVEGKVPMTLPGT